MKSGSHSHHYLLILYGVIEIMKKDQQIDEKTLRFWQVIIMLSTNANTLLLAKTVCTGQPKHEKSVCCLRPQT